MPKNLKEIFIASRHEEFKELRNLLTQEIQAYNYLHVHNLDNNEAEDSSALQKSLECARTCDIMILLVGESYGSIPEGYDKSYTHLEYDEAKENQESKILLYFIGESYCEKEIVYSSDTHLCSWQKELQENKRYAKYCNTNTNEEMLKAIMKDVHTQLHNIEPKKERDTTLLQSNEPSYIQDSYLNDSLRQEEYLLVKEQISNSAKNGALCHFYGPAGIGKSSFLTNVHRELFSENFESLIYYVGNESGENSYHIEGIYVLLKAYILDKLHRINSPIANAIEAISEDARPIDKLKDLKYHYKKCPCFNEENYQIFLCIDGLDTLTNKESFLESLIFINDGIVYISASREPFNANFASTCRRKADGFHVAFEKEYIGEEIKPLSEQSALQHIENVLNESTMLSDEEIHSIASTLYQYSAGLPIYIKYILDDIQVALQNNQTIFEIEKSIQTLPKDLKNFYFEKFEKLQSDCPDAWKLLEILYWFKRELSHKRLEEFTHFNNETLKSALKEIKSFLHVKESNYLLHHQSLYDAIFEFLCNDNARSVAQYVKLDSLEKWSKEYSTPLQTLLLHSDIPPQLQDICIMTHNQALYSSLKSITQYLIQNSATDIQALEIYYSFAKIRYFLAPLHVSDLNDSTMEQLLYKENTDEEFRLILYKIFTLFNLERLDSLYMVEKLYAISILSSDSFIQAQYLQNFWRLSHSKQLRKVIKQTEISSDMIAPIDSSLSRMYIVADILLNKKNITEDLHIHQDKGFIILCKKSKKHSLHASAFNQIQVLSHRNNKGAFENYKSTLNQINGSRDIELRSLCLSRIYGAAKYKNNPRLLKKVQQELLEPFKLETLLLDMQHFDETSELFKYSTMDTKKEVRAFKKHLDSYKTDKNKAQLYHRRFISYIPYYLDEEELHTFTLHVNENSKFNDISELLLQNIAKISTKIETLEYIYQILKQNSSNRSNLFSMMHILIKTSNTKEFNKLFDSIVKMDYTRVEQSSLHHLSNRADTNFLEVLNTCLRYPSFNLDFIIYWIKCGHLCIEDIHAILKLLHQNNRKNTIENIIKKSIFLLNINEVSSIMDLYFDSIKYKRFLSLRFFLNKNFERFLEFFSTFVQKDKVEFLNLYLDSIKNNKEIDINETLSKLILSLIHPTSNNISDVHLLSKGFYFNNFRTFIKNNKAFIEKKMLAFSDKKGVANTLFNLLQRYYAMTLTTQELIEFINENDLTDEQKAQYANDSEEITDELKKYLTPFSQCTLALKDNLIVHDYSRVHLEIKNLFTLSSSENFINDTFIKREKIVHYFLTRYSMHSDEKESDVAKVLAQKSQAPYLARYLNMKHIKSNGLPNENSSNLIINYLKYFVLKDKYSAQNISTKEEALRELYALHVEYKMAEFNDDEESYAFYENALSTLIESLVQHKEFASEFNWLNRQSLHSIFKGYNPFSVSTDVSSSQRVLNANDILYDYNLFYAGLKELYDEYEEAERAEDEERYETLTQTFLELRATIIEQPELLDALFEKSTIPSKLAIKLDNISMFKMR